jgi:hypothetical protein
MSPITSIAMGDKIIDIRSFREVFSGDLRHLTEENNVVPLRSFFLLTVLREGLSSSKTERANRASVLSRDVAGFWIFAVELKRWPWWFQYLLWIRCFQTTKNV